MTAMGIVDELAEELLRLRASMEDADHSIEVLVVDEGKQ